MGTGDGDAGGRSNFPGSASPKSRPLAFQKETAFLGRGGACFALAVCSLPLLFQQTPSLSLTRSKGVSAVYVEEPAEHTFSSGDLPWLTEEQLLNGQATHVFLGKVVGLQNLRLDFNGSREYRALAAIEVEKAYRGGLSKGSVVTLLLPCPINAQIAVSETQVASAFRIGMRGIFMPKAYQAQDATTLNGATLYLQELAEYGLPDGERYAFLETEQGLIYARWAYEGLEGAQTLEDVTAYLAQRLTQQTPGRLLCPSGTYPGNRSRLFWGLTGPANRSWALPESSGRAQSQ